MFDRDFYDELFLNRDRTLFVKIELLNWNEEPVREIQGEITDGSASIDGNSPIRRSLNLNFVLDSSVYEIEEVAEQIDLSKKIAAYIGLQNTTNYARNPDALNLEFNYLSEPIIWFKLGIFVPTNVSFSHSVDDSSISLSAQDKMVLLNGDIAGQLGSDIEFVSTITKTSIAFIDIIKEAVGYFGELDRSKIIILDLPYYADSLARTTTTTSVYIDTDNRSFDFLTGLEYTASSAGTTISQINNEEIVSLQFLLAPTPQNKIEVSSENTVVQILDKVVESIPGVYEYFFDIDGNFIFQLKRNLTNRITEIESLQDVYDPKYSSNFDTIPYIYDFRDKQIVSSYNSSPSWRGIKNDFYLYGKDNIFYHVAIDERPDTPETFYGFTTATVEISGTIGLPTISASSVAGIITGSYVENGSAGFEYGTRVIGIEGSVLTLDFPLNSSLSSASVNFLKWDEDSFVSYNQPWQQYIIDFSEFNLQINPGLEESKYYPELKKFFQYNSYDDTGIYKKNTATTGIWRSAAEPANEALNFNASNPKGIASSWRYFFDIIDDSYSEVSKFSVNSIGRRVKSIKDNTISVLYFPSGLSPIDIQPTFSKKIIVFRAKEIRESVLEFQSKNENAIFLEEEFKSLGIDYISILDSQIDPNITTDEFNYINDAFSNIKNLIYNHTRFNETVSFDIVPLYFLTENSRVALEDRTVQVSGDYYLTSFSIPFSNESPMSCEAIKIYTQ